MLNWLQKHIIWTISLASLFIVVAFGIGLLVKNWPFISLDRSINITDAIGVILTVLLAFLIPYFINHFIEKGNKINSQVLSEVERYRNQLDETHSRFQIIFRNGKITDDNKTELFVLSELLEAKFEILNSVIKSRCKNHALTLTNQLKEKQVFFYNTLTSSKINGANITVIEPAILLKEITYYTEITELITKINLTVTNQ